MKRNAMVLAAALLPLLAARAVTFTEDAHIPDGDATYEGQPVTVSGCTLTVDGAHVFTNLYLVNSATLTHTAGSAGMTLTVSGTVSVASTASIDVSGRGDWPHVESSGAGGSYGGRGNYQTAQSCATYGDYWNPDELGSGGYGVVAGSSRGGGLVSIEAESLALDGAIRANGQAGPDYSGGGSGGGVCIRTEILTGGGSIQANGGAGGSSAGRAGGGGRVAVYYGEVSGFDLAAIQCTGGEGGGAGTVFTQKTGNPSGRLVFDNEWRGHDSKIPTTLTITSNRFDQLAVRDNARVALTVENPLALADLSATGAVVAFSGGVFGSVFAVTNVDWTQNGTFGFSNRVELAGSSVLRHAAGAASGLRIEADSVAVASTASIDVSGRGDWPHVESSGAGGSYGGRGNYQTAQSCATYGDYWNPDELGSGGYGVVAGSSRGGGLVSIEAESLALDGAIRANGQAGPDYSGGGSGGGVCIRTEILTGGGSIQANGGAGGSSAGRAGGGGRVAVYYGEVSGFDLAAIQCTGGEGGGAGTVFTQKTGNPSGRLVFDNEWRGHDSKIPTTLTITSNRFDQLAVRDNARVALTVENPLALAALSGYGSVVAFSGDVHGSVFSVTDVDWTQSGSFGFSNLVALAGASTLRHGAGFAAGLHIHAVTVTVASASSIEVGARGSWPKTETTGRAGGSYGGRGEYAYGDSCPVYGDALAPAELGSGGRGISLYGDSRGGGLVRIEADVLTLNGAIRANGQDGPDYCGGGSGGGIRIEAGVLAGAGSLRANGGKAGYSGGGDGGGGRIAVYAQNAEAFTPSALEAKANAGAGWGTVFIGVPRTVSVTCTGQGVCDPAGPVAIPYSGTNAFAFTPAPVSLATNGTDITPAASFEWVNTGLWRGTLADAAWLEKLNGCDTLDAAFEALAAGQAVAQPGGGMAVTVNGKAGWRYTLERRASLTEGEWLPVTGQIEILCGETGPLVLTDAAVLPKAFYRVVARP